MRGRVTNYFRFRTRCSTLDLIKAQKNDGMVPGALCFECRAEGMRSRSELSRRHSRREQTVLTRRKAMNSLQLAVGVAKNTRHRSKKRRNSLSPGAEFFVRARRISRAFYY